MYFIRTESGETVVSQNHPADDILAGLITHWGEGITVARLKTGAAFAEYRAIPNVAPDVDWEAGTAQAFTRPLLPQVDPDVPPVLGEPESAATFEIDVIYPAPAE